MTQQTSGSVVHDSEDSLRHAYRDQYNERGYHPAHEVDEAFDQQLTTIRAAVVDEVAAFLDSVYQGKAADLIRAKARAGRFVGPAQ